MYVDDFCLMTNKKSFNFITTEVNRKRTHTSLFYFTIKTNNKNKYNEQNNIVIIYNEIIIM